MRKLLFLALMSLVFILGACTEQESATAEQSKEEINVVKEKENELIVEVDGKKEIVAARIEKDATDFIKEIKVPENAEVNVDFQSGSYVVTDGPLKFSYKVEKADEVVSLERVMERYKRKMELTNPSGELVPVNEIDLNKYQSLKEKFDGMMMVDGEKEKEFLLVKVYEKDGQKYKREAKFYIAAESYNEQLLDIGIAMIGSIKE